MKHIIKRIYRFYLQKACMRRNVKYASDVVVGRGSIVMAPDLMVIERRVKIGIYTSILVNGRICDGTQISSYVAIVGRHDHLTGEPGQRPFDAPWIFEEGFPMRDQRHEVILERDVWIGWGATLLSGIKVGCGAVIAAGALVTRDVPPYAVMAGSPARQIGSVFDDDQIVRHERVLREKYPELFMTAD